MSGFLEGARQPHWPYLLGLSLVIQVICVIYFVADVIWDLASGGLGPHSLIESLAAIALAISVFLGALQMRQLVDRNRRSEEALSVASIEFSNHIRRRFDEWGLTPAEAEVAFFTLKGMDVSDTAALRGAAAGTVRAQLARVYNKAEVTNRGQLISLFIEDLLQTPLTLTGPSGGIGGKTDSA